jgi:hypothetical protein
MSCTLRLEKPKKTNEKEIPPILFWNLCKKAPPIPNASKMDIATCVVSIEGVRQMCAADLQLSQRSSVQRLAEMLERCPSSLSVAFPSSSGSGGMINR